MWAALKTGIHAAEGHLDDWNLSNMDVDDESGKAFLKRHHDLADRLQMEAHTRLISAAFHEFDTNYVFETVPEAQNSMSRLLETRIAERKILSYRLTVDRSQIIVDLVMSLSVNRIDFNFFVGP